MSKTYVVTVGEDISVHMKSGDGLFLVFCEHRKFCVLPSAPDLFPDNSFPTAPQPAGTIWPTNGSPAISKGTGSICYTSAHPHDDCPTECSEGEGEGVNITGHTITVGS